MPAVALLVAALIVSSPGRPGRPIAKPAGSVTGILRHKGCGTAPAGATVAVIGRDASAVADAEGAFALRLPPGVYSLVFGGPGLVPDQRLDDVMLVEGQGRDLGVVEVWPEERPAGCVPGIPAPQAPAIEVATAPDAPAVDLPGAAVAPSPVLADQIWVRGGGGTAPGQFGLRGNPARDDEDALGPSSFAVGPPGQLWVLDALNWRVQRFDARGHPTSSFAVTRPGEDPFLEADLAVSDDGHVFLFTAGEPPILTEHDASGRVLVGGSLPPSFRGVDLLFAGRQRPVFLMQNGQAVRAELAWGGVRAEGPLPGLPVGNLFVHADRLDRWRAVLKLSSAQGRVKRSVQLHSRVPIAGVRLVGVERRGEIVVAIDRVEGHDESTPRAEVLLLAVDQLGQLAGTVSVPPGGRRFEFREFALNGDGSVVQMQSDTAEVRFVRWTLRPPPRDAVAGEGLVRGRVVERTRAVPTVTATMGRTRRSVPVATDGTFEARLSAGTWLVSFRSTGGAQEVIPIDLRVTVAPGSTVDLGTVTLATRPPRAPGGNGAAAAQGSSGAAPLTGPAGPPGTPGGTTGAALP